MNRRLFAALARREAALASNAQSLRARGRGLAGPSRRQFIQRGLAAGLAAGLPLLSACGGGGDDPAPPAQAPKGKVLQTLYFNLSHLDHAGKTHYLEAGGKSYRLTPVAEAPQVLAGARQTNQFLAGVPDHHITHHVLDVALPEDTVQMMWAWTWANPTDHSDGLWLMTGIYSGTPAAASVAAYAHSSAHQGAATLRLSHKRRRYGLRAAASAQDLADEAVLIDPSVHASTLIASNPNFLSLDANTHASISSSYVDGSSAHDDLADALTRLGPATIDLTNTGQPTNPNAWATLRPMLDKAGTPLRVTQDANSLGRIQAMPIYHPNVAAAIGAGHLELTPPIFDDTSLGLDTTAGPSAADAKGKVWMRRDGRPTVVTTSTSTAPRVGAAPSTTTMTRRDSSPDNGLDCDITSTDQGTTILLEADFSNVYLRYLSLWVEFFDEADKPINLGDVPGFTAGTLFNGPTNQAVNPATWSGRSQCLIGVIPASGTVMGVPVNAGPFLGAASVSINVPKSVHRVSFMSGGLGTGPNNDPLTISGGAALTILNNYVVTGLFAALGAIPELDPWKSILATFLYAFVEGMFTLGIDVSTQTSDAQFWTDEAATLVTSFMNFVAGKGAEAWLTAVFEALGKETLKLALYEGVEKAVPIAGLIMNAVSAVIGAADIVLTTVDIALSPWTYYNDVVFAYDLVVTLKPDPNDSTFPQAANLITVTAMFDDGTPHVTTLPWSGGNDQVLSVTLPNAPQGGLVNVSVSFEQKATVAGANNVLLGIGSTGLIPNPDTDPAHPGQDQLNKTITLKEIAFPIGSTTEFQHIKRTARGPDGRHVWVNGAAPTISLRNLVSGNPGQVSALRSITVRQGTSQPFTVPRRLGYTWVGYNNPGGPASCQGAGQGDLEQVATLNADDPSLQFVASTCASQYGAQRAAFSLTGGGEHHYYLDTSSNNGLVRQIRIEPAPVAIDGFASNQAWCSFTLPCDALLLHPGGFFVSVCNQFSTLQVLKIPDAPMADADALTKLRALTLAGFGTRPGRMDTPVSATITSTGALLVLEYGNNRIQAFDMGGNPVPHFPQLPAKYYLTLPDTDPAAGWVHLDMKTDFTDLIYVLSYNTNTFEYRMNIYTRDQADLKPISTTKNIYADKIAIDLWRNLYTLNYEVVKYRDTPTIPVALAEPTVSLWTPCNVGQTCPVG